MDTPIDEQPITMDVLGWNPAWEDQFAAFRQQGFEPGRVAIEDKHHYEVLTPNGLLLTQIPGKLLHQARSLADLPKVGDWAALSPLPAKGRAVLRGILPRRNKLSRKIAGRETEEQVLVTNIDLAFVVQGCDSTFNPRLLERYLMMLHESGASAVILLNKADLCDDSAATLAEAEKVAGASPVLVVSARTGQGMGELRRFMAPGSTAVFMGTSGVGKSSLINRLYGDRIQATTEVRESDSKGRHTTSWREMIVLPSGGLVIDTPGMREFHIWIAGQGLQEAFPEIEELGLRCKFTNCAHSKEKGCAVLTALANGELPLERHQAYLKLRHELEFLEKAQHGWRYRKRRGTD